LEDSRKINRSNTTKIQEKMKYIIVLGDGMADEPIAQLGNKTPLQVAHTFPKDLLREAKLPICR
jgi:2,3-bisphosphoglycerate-independent phosphoglycerate mutase